MALSHSEDPILEQAALCERLDRQLWVLADRKTESYNERIAESGLRSELQEALRLRHPAEQPYAQLVGPVMKGLYDARMRLTGQNGLADYDEGFTNFLMAVEREA